MNICVFIGNLTRDPELRVSQGGTSICTFTIAVNRPSDHNGELRADYIPIKCFKSRTESCQKYLHKGSKVCVKGTLQTYTYQAQDGSKRNGFEILVGNDGEVMFLPRTNRYDAPVGGRQAAQQNVSPQQLACGGSSDGFAQADGSELPF